MREKPMPTTAQSWNNAVLTSSSRGRSLNSAEMAHSTRARAKRKVSASTACDATEMCRGGCETGRAGCAAATREGTIDGRAILSASRSTLSTATTSTSIQPTLSGFSSMPLTTACFDRWLNSSCKTSFLRTCSTMS